jgi:hypothetical protein
MVGKWLKSYTKKLLKKRGYKVNRFSHETKLPDIPKNKYSYFTLHYFLHTVKKLGLPINNILDIGANRTQWSKEVKWFFPAAHFFLVEPQVEMEDALRDFCSTAAHGKYFLAGAGSEPGEMTLTIWEDLQGSSLLPEVSEQLTNKRGETTQSSYNHH